MPLSTYLRYNKQNDSKIKLQNLCQTVKIAYIQNASQHSLKHVDNNYCSAYSVIADVRNQVAYQYLPLFWIRKR